MIGKIGGQRTEAVGISLGLDRIIEVMKEQNMIPRSGPAEKVFVANVDDSVRGDAIKVAQELREKGVDCQMNLTDRFISKQMELANSLGIRYVVIVGKDEVKSKKYKLRDMMTKEQNDLDVGSIADTLKRA